MNSNIILIGPIRAGKSTVGALLSQQLGVPQVSMDKLCRSYYEELRPQGADTVSTGPDGLIASSLTLHALERLLQAHQGCVIDMGGGHSYFPEDASLERAKTLLASHPNVVLLLPLPDLQESAKILAKRNANNPWVQQFIKENGVDPNEQFLNDESNFVLAKHIIYTNGKSPLETCNDVLDRIGEQSAAGSTDTLSERPSEIVEMLSDTLEKAKQGWIRSIVVITVQHDDAGGCWARTSSSDTTMVSEYMEGIKQDMG